MKRVPLRLAFRRAADGFVYVYLADKDSMDDAVEIGRMSEAAMNMDDRLWTEFKAALAGWISRQTAAHLGASPKSVITIEEKPPERPA